MNDSEKQRIDTELDGYASDCRSIADFVEGATKSARVPAAVALELEGLATDAENLRLKILNTLLQAGPEVDDWRKLVEQIGFAEYYWADREIGIQRRRPNAASLVTAAGIIDTVCRHLRGIGGIESQQPKVRGRRGPKPDMARHWQIAEAVKARGVDYQTCVGLKAVCRALDVAKVPISPEWRRPGVRMTWEHAAGLYRWNVTKALTYALKMAAKYPRP
jgi:hypothetical protein